jgi:hypothetical protein
MIDSNFDYKRKLKIQIAIDWALGTFLILSVLLNALQLGDRMYQQKKINALQITGGALNFKIQPADTTTYGLYYPKKHKK